jgi:hypothetical protein
MIYEIRLQVAEKEKLYRQVMMMKPQWAPVLFVEGGIGRGGLLRR